MSFSVDVKKNSPKGTIKKSYTLKSTKYSKIIKYIVNVTNLTVEKNR